jgi:hypothetical protein
VDSGLLLSKAIHIKLVQALMTKFTLLDIKISFLKNESRVCTPKASFGNKIRIELESEKVGDANIHIADLNGQIIYSSKKQTVFGRDT